MYAYDDRFFDTADHTAELSADGVIRHLIGQLPITSVLDLGCGRGVWLARWMRQGVTDALGVDGPYVAVDRLHVPRSAFLARDLAQPLALDRPFDLVQSLEVAEHLGAAAADQFVDNLVSHGRLVLFSAAIPGQGGEHHVNEQPWSYWRAKFHQRGFELFDYLRPLIKQDRSIYFWYRHNIFLYGHRSITAALPAPIRASRIGPEQAIANYLPPVARLRTAAIRCLPRPAVDRLAKLKHQVSNWTHDAGRGGR